MSFADGLLKGAKMGYGWVQAYQQGQEWQDEANFRQAIKDADSVYSVLKDGAESLPNDTPQQKLDRLTALNDARTEYDNMVKRAYLDNYGGRGGALYANLAGAIGKTWDNQYKDAYKDSMRANGRDIIQQETGGAIPVTPQAKQPVAPQQVQQAPAPAAATPAAPIQQQAPVQPAPQQAKGTLSPAAGGLITALQKGDPKLLKAINLIGEQNGISVSVGKNGQVMWQPMGADKAVPADPRLISSLMTQYLDVGDFLRSSLGGQHAA